MIKQAFMTTGLMVIVSACGENPTTTFYTSEQQPTKTQADGDALPQIEVDPSKGQTVSYSKTTVGKSEEEGEEKTEETPKPPTVEEILATCKNTEVKSLAFSVAFPANTETCKWGTKVLENGVYKEILSDNGNLSILNGWIRAREEFTHTIEAPVDSLICGVNMVANTNTIHFDDFFAIRVNEFMIAGSKVLSNALMADQDGHLVWDWPRIRGDGATGAGTRMQDLGKYFMTGAGELPEHDRAGPFSLEMSFTELENPEDPIERLKAAFYAKLSGKKIIDFTLVATGDDDTGDCYHSGGNFTITLQYVKKGKK